MDFLNGKLIGMVHLKPLPGSYQYKDDLSNIIDHAVTEAKKIEDSGFDAVMVENFHDVPFSKEVEPVTVSSMSVIGKEIMEEVSIPVGINVLRNDALASYSVAYSVDADFIRVNVLSGVALTDQGIIEGSAQDLFDLRRRVQSDIQVLADVHVKHAHHFSDFTEAIDDTVERGLADAVVVSGERTGGSVEPNKLRLAKENSNAPVIVGSGVTKNNLSDLWDYGDTFIVGTSIKKNGVTNNDIDLERAKDLVKKAQDLRV